MNIFSRLSYLENLTKLRQRFLRSCTCLSEARESLVFNQIEELIATLSNRINQSLEPDNTSTPLTAEEITLVSNLYKQIEEL